MDSLWQGWGACDHGGWVLVGRLGLYCLWRFRDVSQILCGMRVVQAVPAAQAAGDEGETVGVKGLSISCDVMWSLAVVTDTGHWVTDITDRRCLLFYLKWAAHPPFRCQDIRNHRIPSSTVELLLWTSSGSSVMVISSAMDSSLEPLTQHWRHQKWRHHPPHVIVNLTGSSVTSVQGSGNTYGALSRSG